VSLAVFIDNQIHERDFAGPEVGRTLTSLLPFAEKTGQLQHVYPHGDTMFHAGQIRELMQELQGIRASHPETAQGIDHLIELLSRAIKLRGYVWIEGD
jgi:hypothetical protein